MKTRRARLLLKSVIALVVAAALAGCRASVFAPAPVAFERLERIRTLAGARSENGASLFGEPFAVAVGGDDTVYVTDGARGCVWAINAEGATRQVACGLSTPSGVAVAPDGSLVVAETGAHVIRRIKIGDGASEVVAGVRGEHGFADGTGGAARFDAPVGVATDADGTIYVADTYNDLIRRISPSGEVSTIAGGAEPAYADAESGTDARFHTPCNVVVRARGKLVVADAGNHRLREIDLTASAHKVTTLAGTGEVLVRDGDLASSAFEEPIGLAVAHDGALLVADAGGDALRRVTFGEAKSADGNQTTAAQTPARVTTINPQALTPDEDRRAFARTTGFRDGGLDQALARRPSGVAVTRRGRIIFADADNRLVRVIAEQDSELGEETEPTRQFALLPDAAALRQNGAPRWAFDPAERPREIAATFGEVRGVIEEGRQAWWHNGLDIPGAFGETVRFVRPETVLLPLAVEGTGGARERLRLPALGYIHVRIGRDADDRSLLADDRFRFIKDEQGRTTEVRVRRGARFAAGEPVGTLNNQNHVHLIAGAPGAEVNALAALELPGVRDTIAPTIVREAVRFERPEGGVYGEERNSKEVADSNTKNAAAKTVVPVPIDGDARIVVRAFDRMDGGAERRRLGVYALGYQVLDRDGKPVEGFAEPHIDIEFLRLPEASAPDAAYAPPSRAGYTPETFFDYIVTNRVRDREAREDVWRASLLAPGDYTVRVIARDFFGNEAEEDFRVRVERRS